MSTPDPHDHHYDRSDSNNTPINRLKNIFVYYEPTDNDEKEPDESFWGTEPDPLWPWIIRETALKTWVSVALHYERPFHPQGGTCIHRIFAIDLDERERMNALRRRRSRQTNRSTSHVIPPPAAAAPTPAAYESTPPDTDWEPLMSTIILRLPTAPFQRRPVPAFDATTLRAYARYLAAREGVDHLEFTTTELLPDEDAALAFVIELRRQLGAFLTEVISVQQKRHHVWVVLRDGFPLDEGPEDNVLR